MNTKLILPLSAIVILLFASCTKKPNASFVFENASYFSGDSLIIKNTSTLSNTYRWTLPTGLSVTTKDLRIKLDSALESGYYKYKLEAFSKNRKLVDAVEQTIFVNTRKFRVVFWTDAPSTNNRADIAVTFNYESRFIIGFNYSDNNKPTYSSPNVASFVDIPYGKYNYSAIQYSTADTYKDATLANTNPPIHIIQVIPGKQGSSWNETITVNSDMIIKLPHR